MSKISNGQTEEVGYTLPAGKKIDGMLTFEEQVKQKPKQRLLVEAKLAKLKASEKTDKKKTLVIGPTYLQSLANAMVDHMKSSSKLTDFLKLQKYYSNLKESVYKALESCDSFAGMLEYLKTDKFYSSKTGDPSGDVRNFFNMCKTEAERFANSKAYKEANPQQKTSMEQNEMTVLKNYGQSIDNSAQRDQAFVKKLRNDSDGDMKSFDGIGNFLNSTALGYAGILG